MSFKLRSHWIQGRDSNLGPFDLEMPALPFDLLCFGEPLSFITVKIKLFVVYVSTFDFKTNKTGLQPVSRPVELVHYFGGLVEC